ncbi:AAA domain-containing protein [Cytidiella melzeri]|nr:AAA domain-containing protein [Cytidiella melzeri]
MSKSHSQVAAAADSRHASTRAIFVVGPSSSGKTTLCNAIAEKLQVDPARHIKEVARTVMRAQNFSRHTVKTYEMQHAIMQAQVAEEKRVLSMPQDERSRVWLLSDRSAVDPIVYASTSGVPEAGEMRNRLLHQQSFLDALPLYRTSLFVALSAVPEWIEDDGVRSLDDPSNYHTQLCNILSELGISFVKIGDNMRNLTRRVEFVEEHLLRDR